MIVRLLHVNELCYYYTKLIVMLTLKYCIKTYLRYKEFKNKLF